MKTTSNIGFCAPANAYMNPEKKHFHLVALIDADRLKHLVANDVFQDINKGIPRAQKKIDEYIEKRISDVFKMFSAKGYIFCFSGKSFNTFRNHVSFEKEYKGNRKNDPSYYEGKLDDMSALVDKVMNTYPTLIFTDLEADDILCMLQNKNTFIVSNDKDLKQIPGQHFCPERKIVFEISEEEAFKNLCYQLIIGDTTDNITGLKGYGPKKAQTIIDQTPVKNLINRILHEYQMNFGLTAGTDSFVENWNLVKLRMNRGTHFIEKYSSAFNLLNLIINS